MKKRDSTGKPAPLFRKSKALSLDGLGVEALLYEADTRQDPVIAHQALMLAESLEPDNLEVQRRLLLLGRLHERNPRQPDYSVIKCYLLHAFEHPEEHTEAQQKQMARELFDDPRLLRCLQLAQDQAAFLREYLEELSREYLRVFVAADSRHVPRVFGVSFRGSLQKYLAQPARDILCNLLSSPFLSAQEAGLAARAFYRAFFEYAHGDVRGLDQMLGAEIRAQLR